MKKTVGFTLFMSMIIIFSGCKKTLLTGDYASYVGYWRSSTTTLKLEADGTGDYDYQKGNVSKYIHGGRVIISGSTLKIKLFLVSKKYTITKPPTSYIDSVTYQTVKTMTLDDEVFTH